MHKKSLSYTSQRDLNQEEASYSRNSSQESSSQTRHPGCLPAKDTEASREQPRPKELLFTWLSFPNKSQLAILFLCLFVDFLQVASLQAYVFYQLKNFNPGATDASISTQAGILQGCFTGTQALMAIPLRKVADSSAGGRKLVLLAGLSGTAVSCLGYGFSTTFAEAVVWRVLGGVVNGTVRLSRTMIAEIMKEKRYQCKAFLILPMSFNVAWIVGPLMGGMLADPVTTFPYLFEKNTTFGFQWLRDYPYALPGVINAITLGITTLVVFLGLEETHSGSKMGFELGLYWSAWISKMSGRSESGEYTKPSSFNRNKMALENTDAGRESENTLQILPFRRIWTSNVICTLVAIAFFDFHLGAFDNLWPLFLSTPRSNSDPTSVFNFTGGLGMPTSAVGFATAIIGVLGMAFQLFLYPSIHARLGTLHSFRLFLLLFPIAYFLAPYLAVATSTTAPPEPVSGLSIWFDIVIVLFLQVLARTFTLPATNVLLNDCTPHPSVLGTVLGIGQSVSAASRTVGIIVGGWLYGMGLEYGVVGVAWWGIAIVAAVGCVFAIWIYEDIDLELHLDDEGARGVEIGALWSKKECGLIENSH